MKKLFFLFITLSLLSCSARKKANELSNRGNHAAAIDVLVNKLANGVSERNKPALYSSLHNSYLKLVSQSKDRLNYLKWDNSSNKYEETFNLYSTLVDKQQKIKPFLPIAVNGRMLNFLMEDYAYDLVQSKNQLTDFLYSKALGNLKSNNKLAHRQTFDDLVYLNQLQPGYKNVTSLIDEARFKGTDFIFISVENRTQMALPKRLEEELLQLSTFGLNDKWTVYHSLKRYDTKYDYQIKFNFQNLFVTPERVEKNRFYKERVIVDGWEYAKDTQGKQIKDSLGKLVKIDKKITISCEIEELIQMKDATIGAKVEFWDEHSNQLVEDFPLQSNFSFRDISARVRGDKRALDEDYIPNIKSPIPFPSNEQLIYQGGQNLKNQLKDILVRYRR